MRGPDRVLRRELVQQQRTVRGGGRGARVLLRARLPRGALRAAVRRVSARAQVIVVQGSQSRKQAGRSQ